MEAVAEQQKENAGNAKPATENHGVVAELQPAREIESLSPIRFRACEFERTVWVVTTHPKHKPEDLLRNDYWTNVADKLNARDRIEAWADDGSWYGEYVVLQAERLWTRVALLNLVDMSSVQQSDAESPSGEYRVEWKGPHRKWSVIRSVDDMVVMEGETSREPCDAWVKARYR